MGKAFNEQFDIWWDGDPSTKLPRTSPSLTRAHVAILEAAAFFEDKRGTLPTQKELACLLFKSAHVVRKQISEIYLRLGLQSRGHTRFAAAVGQYNTIKTQLGLKALSAPPAPTPTRLSALQETLQQPPVRIGALCTGATMLHPCALLGDGGAGQLAFQDNDDARHRLCVTLGPSDVPTAQNIVNAIETAIAEASDEAARHSLENALAHLVPRGRAAAVRRSGINPACHLTAAPEILQDDRGSILKMSTAESHYGMQLLARRDLARLCSPPLDAEYVTYSLCYHSLGVRAALVDGASKPPQVLIHRRPRFGDLFDEYWDVGVGGYFDPGRQEHRVEQRMLSTNTLLEEVAEELDIHRGALPTWEHVVWYGAAYASGGVSLLGRAQLQHGTLSKPQAQNTQDVARVETIALTPEAVSCAIAEKRCWVPHGLLNLVLVLIHHIWEDTQVAPDQIMKELGCQLQAEGLSSVRTDGHH